MVNSEFKKIENIENKLTVFRIRVLQIQFLHLLGLNPNIS
jgi:hypothetical protein